jgi:hypothetical protein
VLTISNRWSSSTSLGFLRRNLGETSLFARTNHPSVAAGSGRMADRGRVDVDRRRGPLAGTVSYDTLLSGAVV